MMNREVLLVLVLGCMETGTGWARQNPAGLRDRFGGGTSFEEFVRLDMRKFSKL